MARFANTIDNQPIYAARAEADKNGDRIDTTYAKLTDIPTVPVQNVEVDGNSVVNAQGVAEITMPTVDQTYDGSSTNAQSGTAVAGAIATVNQVPTSTSADQDKVLTVDSLGIPSWAIVPQSPTELFEAAYGVTSFADVMAAIVAKKIVYCTVKSGANQYRKAFLAYMNSSKVEFQYYRSISTHDATDQGDEVCTYSVSSSGWTTKTRLSNIRYMAGTNMTQSYSPATETLTFSATVPTKTSDLQNDSGYITSADVPVTDVTVNGTSVVSSGTAAVTVPTATSDLQNDSGFITLSDVPAQQQADWTESDSSDPSYIAHKPNLAAVATSGQYSDLSGTPAIPTVDSSYNASSYNAQSGVAVAQAIAAVPTASYTAGDAIEIDNDEISVVYDSDTLELQQQPPVTHTYNVDSYTTGTYDSTYGVTPPDVVNQLRTVSVTVHVPGNTFYSANIYGQTPVIVFKTNSYDGPVNGAYCATPLSYTYSPFGKSYLNEQDVVITTLVGDAIGNYFTFGFTSAGYLSNDVWKCDTTTLADPVVFSYTSAGYPALAVKNPLPASTVSDADKVLKVDSNGNPAWATGGGGSPYTAGNGIDITNDEISVDTSVVATQTDLSGKQDTLTAGSNVSISNNVISATDTTYSAGEGIDITNNEISVEAPVDIVAGPGIVIDNPDGNTLRVSQQYPTDETVLYQAATNEGTILQLDQYVTLSESMTHFERVRIYYALQKDWAGKQVFECYMVDGDVKVNLHDVWYREQSGFNVWYETLTYNKYTDSNLRFTQAGGVQRAILNTTWNTTSGLTTIVYKIVGVHRLVANN